MLQVLVSLSILSLSLAEPPPGNPGSSSRNASRSDQNYDVDSNSNYFREHISETNEWTSEQQVPGEINSEYASYQHTDTTEPPGFLASTIQTRQAPPFATPGLSKVYLDSAKAIYVPPLPDTPPSSENGLPSKYRLAYNERQEASKYQQRPSSSYGPTSSKVPGKGEFGAEFHNIHSQPNFNVNSETRQTNLGGNRTPLSAFDSQAYTLHDSENQNYRPHMNSNGPPLTSSSSINADKPNDAPLSGSYITQGNQEYWPLLSSHESSDLASSSFPKSSQNYRTPSRSYHPHSSSNAHADNPILQSPREPYEFPHTIPNSAFSETLSQEPHPSIFGPPSPEFDVSQKSEHLLNLNGNHRTESYKFSAYSNGQDINQNVLSYSNFFNTPASTSNEQHSRKPTTNSYDNLMKPITFPGEHENYRPPTNSYQQPNNDQNTNNKYLHPSNYYNPPALINGKQHNRKTAENYKHDLTTPKSFPVEKQHYRPPTNFYEQPNNGQNGDLRHPSTSYGPPAYVNGGQHYNIPANNSYNAAMTDHSWTSPPSSTEFHYNSEHETSLKPLDSFTQAPPLLKPEEFPPKNYRPSQVSNSNGLTSSSQPLAAGMHIQNSYSAGSYEFKYEVGKKKVRNQFIPTNSRDNKSFTQSVRPSDITTQKDAYKSDNYEITPRDTHNPTNGIHPETSSYTNDPNDNPVESPGPASLLLNSGRPQENAGYHY